jgi:hypothetical protein
LLLGEPEDARRPFALTINNVQQVAGYVIRLPGRDVQQPRALAETARTIEGEAEIAATIDARPNGHSAVERYPNWEIL